MSQSEDASTARTEPSLIAITNRKPRTISTTVWVTAPPSKIRAAPWVRLDRPEATAASWSARSRGKPLETASSRPSDETTTVCATPGTRSTKLVISKLRICAAWLSSLTVHPLPKGTSVRWWLPQRGCGTSRGRGGTQTSCALPVGSGSVLVLARFGLAAGRRRVATLPQPLVEAGEPAAYRVRRARRDRRGRRLRRAGAARRAGHQVRPGHPLRQALLRQPGRDRLGRRLGRL